MFKAIFIVVFSLFAFIGVLATQSSIFASVIVHFDRAEIRYSKIPQLGRIELRTFLFIRNTSSNKTGCTMVFDENAFDLQDKACVVIEIKRELAGKSLRTDLNYTSEDVLVFDLVRESVTPSYIERWLELVSARARKTVKATISILMIDVKLSEYKIDQQLSKILKISNGMVLLHSRTVQAESYMNNSRLNVISLSKESEGQLLAKGRDIQIRATEELYLEGFIGQIKQTAQAYF